MNNAFWHGKRVFVTGHTGFKGGWLSLWLQEMGAIVTGYSLPPPTNPNLFETANIARGMKTVIGDVRDATNLHRTMAEARPEIVFHLAAQALVRESYKNPVDTYMTNVMGTVNVLEAVRQCGGVKVVVNVTSDKCYENKEWVWGYRETEAMGGFDPYSNSKGCAELVTSAYRNSFFNAQNYREHGVAVATARAGNVIGGGDWAADRLVPDIIRAVVDKEPVQIRNPHAIRPWQHVLEPLSGYLCLAEKCWSGDSTFSNGWNFGPNDDDAKPVSWVVDRLTQKWGDGARWTLDECVHPHEATYLKLDCSKAKSFLGWQPRWTLEQALDAVVEWNRSYYRGQNVREITAEHIRQYRDTL